MKTKTETNRFVVFLFVCYAFVVLAITLYPTGHIFLPDFSGSRIQTSFVPFLKFKEALTTIQTTGLPGGAQDSLRQVLKYIVTIAYGFIANVVMFVPLGIFLPLLSRKMDGLFKVTSVGFAVSLMIELSQIGVMMLFFASKRVFDIDDLIANTMGAAAGYIFYAFFHAVLRPVKRLAQA